MSHDVDAPAPDDLPDTGSPTKSITRSRVGWPEVGVGVLGALIGYAIGIPLIWAVPEGQLELQGITAYLVSGIAPLLGFAAAVLLRIRGLAAFGVRRTSWKWILAGLGGGVAAVALSIVVTIVVVALTGPPSDLQAGYQAASTGGVLSLIITLATGAILTPIGEEFLFRGVLANALWRYGAWVAIPVSSGVFALSHGINYILPVAFIVGVMAALLLRASGSVWPGVVVHMVNNAYSTLATAVLALVGTSAS